MQRGDDITEAESEDPDQAIMEVEGLMTGAMGGTVPEIEVLEGPEYEFENNDDSGGETRRRAQQQRWIRYEEEVRQAEEERRKLERETDRLLRARKIEIPCKVVLENKIQNQQFLEVQSLPK